MFELNITNSGNSKFSQQAEKWRGFDENLHTTFSYISDSITIQGLRYKGEKDDFFRNNQYLTILCGKVFYSLDYIENLMPLTAEMVFSLYHEDSKDFLNKIKGHFIVFICNLQTGDYLIAKDKLGLKYVYYRVIESKYYISTNLNDFKRIDYEFDYNVVLEHLLFSYPISENSFIRQVKMLELGSLIRCEAGKTKIERYFVVDDLFPQQKTLKKFSRKVFVELFEKSVLQRANCDERPNVSLTGGFDGRANVAVMLKNKRSFHAYSFGKKGGENTVVPLILAENLQLDYTPEYLDEEYERDYVECALDAIYFSDGISRFERANYIFAMRRITKNSNINITGLIGGESFAPVHQKSDYINECYYNTFYDDGVVDVDEILKQKYGDFSFMNSFIEKLDIAAFYKILAIHKERISMWKSQELAFLYYLKDMISVGFQRFYGNQMHLERYYCDNLTTFYDMDVLSYLYSTDYIKVFKMAFKNSSPFQRINNRKLQSYIIHDTYFVLGEIPVDRGYPTNYNIDLRKFIIPIQYYKRKLLKYNALPDFNSKYWVSLFFNSKKVTDVSFLTNLVSTESLMNYFRRYNSSSYNRDITAMISLSIWISHE